MAVGHKLEPGAVLAGRYRVLRRLGAGGMGEVFVVRHELTHHERALKTLRVGADLGAEDKERFLREASAAGRIKNPHIVETFDAGFLESGAPYLVMELLEGAPLSLVLHRAGPLEVPAACALLVQTCEAVQAAHDAGVIHRDLKPDNLFVCERDGRPFVKVLDFGLAKMDAASAGATDVTGTGVAMGTPLYMAPEQMRGARKVDARADVYALGVILYECLAGHAPYYADNFADLAALALAGGAPALSTVDARIPPQLSDATARAMAVGVEQRLGSAKALAEALAPFAGSPSSGPAWWRPAPETPIDPLASTAARPAAVPDAAAHPGQGLSATALPQRPPAAPPASHRASRLPSALAIGAAVAAAAGFAVFRIATPETASGPRAALPLAVALDAGAAAAPPVAAASADAGAASLIAAAATDAGTAGPSEGTADAGRATVAAAALDAGTLRRSSKSTPERSAARRDAGSVLSRDSNLLD